ncbi:hypothetical protein [Oryzisolibacter propanilivorax]|uniref:hypothetical protein n=1 Tax=Oryzisolibacter propanilivorax TaxID=1527607 RepID=UPI00111429EF|nr:hypothetical protein [Oryzisolibacter propanilivorax]
MKQRKLNEKGPAATGAFHCGELTARLYLQHANKFMVCEMPAKAAIYAKISAQKRAFIVHFESFEEFCDATVLGADNFCQKVAKAAVPGFSAGQSPLVKEPSLSRPVVAMLTLPLAWTPVAYILLRFIIPNWPCICALPLNLMSLPKVEHAIAACWM